MITSINFPKRNRLSTLFDGINDYTDMTGDSDVSLWQDDAFTVSIWMRYGINDNNFMTLLNYIDSGAFQYYIYGYTGVYGNSIFCAWYNLGTSIGLSKTWPGPSDLNYHHLNITNDGSETLAGLKFYLDGVEQTATLEDAGVPQVSVKTDGKTRLGADVNDASFPFRGYFDEVSLWNKALDSTEVTELYNSGLPSNLYHHSAIANCTRWWRMGEASTYPTIQDQRSNSVAVGKKLTMTNMPSNAFKQVVP